MYPVGVCIHDNSPPNGSSSSFVKALTRTVCLVALDLNSAVPPMHTPTLPSFLYARVPHIQSCIATRHFTVTTFELQVTSTHRRITLRPGQPRMPLYPGYVEKV